MKFLIKHLSEANIQAEFYHQCRKRGIQCFLEYNSQLNGQKSCRRKGIRACRFDAVIVKNGEITHIVEIKQDSSQEGSGKKQIARYSIFGIPVLVVRGYKKVLQIVERIEKDLKITERTY